MIIKLASISEVNKFITLFLINDENNLLCDKFIFQISEQQKLTLKYFLNRMSMFENASKEFTLSTVSGDITFSYKSSTINLKYSDKSFLIDAENVHYELGLLLKYSTGNKTYGDLNIINLNVGDKINDLNKLNNSNCGKIIEINIENNKNNEMIKIVEGNFKIPNKLII